MPIEVRGLKEALKTLNELDPALRRQITKDIRKIAEPALAAIRSEIPSQAPLSGMNHAGHTGWQGNEKQLPRVLLNAKKPRVRRKAGTEFVSNVGTIVISAPSSKKGGARGAAFAIADMAAQSKSRRDLPGKLNAAVGRQASRFMWFGADRALPEVTANIEDAAREIIKEANRQLAEKR